MIYFKGCGGVLLHGDCLEEMKRLPDHCIDMILCDLPYGTTKCAWDKTIPFEPLWNQYNRIAKKNAAIVLTASQPFTTHLGMSNIDELRYSWVWDKQHATGHLNAKKRPLKAFEDILVFYKSPPVYNPQGLTYSPKKMRNSRSHCARGADNATSTVTGGIKADPYIQEYSGYPDGIICIKGSNGNKQHPTQKPVALFEYLIKTYTNEGALVLDNCSGSGTSALACKNTSRRWCCIESSLDYCELTVRRLRGEV